MFVTFSDCALHDSTPLFLLLQEYKMPKAGLAVSAHCKQRKVQFSLALL